MEYHKRGKKNEENNFLCLLVNALTAKSSRRNFGTLHNSIALSASTGDKWLLCRHYGETAPICLRAAQTQLRATGLPSDGLSVPIDYTKISCSD
jgi:hypothetical protein